MNYIATVKNLTVQYGQILAVDNVSFELGNKEILVMVGPNGSGKTSIAECIAGLRKPTAGDIYVFERNPQTERERIYSYLGVQLQDAAFPDKIKVEEICKLFSSFYAVPADYRNLLEQLDLMEKKNRYVGKLSGGEKQRLSILLALLPRPKMLILDELTTGLDPEVRRNLWESLTTIRQAGTGVLLISHYMDEAEALADRIIFMLNGRAIYSGTLSNLKDYAKQIIPQELWKPNMSLEDIYLSLVPKRGHITM